MTNSNRIRVGDRVTIYPRGKKKTYVADFWYDGRHQRLSLETANAKVATQKAVQLDLQLSSGTFKAPPPPMSIRQAIENYFEFLTTEGRARKTIVRYTGELHNFRDVMEAAHATRLSQLTPSLFDKFRAHCKDQGHAPRTMFHEAVVVKQWLKWCSRRRLVGENVLTDYKLIKPVLEPRDGPSLEQVEMILKSARGQRLIQYTVLSFTGMRTGECQRLQVVDVDLQNGWFHIVSRDGGETKTRRSRKVPIHPRLRTLLETLPKAKRGWFFTAGPSNRYPNGDHWTNPKRLNDDFVALLKKLNLPAGRNGDGFTIHSLRHFFETFCVNSGIPQRVIDTWLGHRSDTSMASIYYKLSDADSQAFMQKVPFGTGTAAADEGTRNED